jgi:anthranilate synthase component 1
MSTLVPATFEEFEQLTLHGNVIPVVRTVLADLETPLGAYLRISTGAGYSFLLESIEGAERIARYSFLGAHPYMVVRGRGDTTWIQTGTKSERRQGVRAVDFVREHFRGRTLAALPHIAPLAGGAVGYLGYGAARWFEPALRQSASEEDDAFLMFYRTVLALDRLRQQILITTVVFTDQAGKDPAALRSLYEAAVAETETVEAALRHPLGPQSSPSPGPAKTEPDIASNWERRDFETAVDRIKEHIAGGECYQAVLSQRFSTATSAEPIQIYRALRLTNPSPYMFFLRLPGESLIGASPELLVRCRGRQLEYRPIAGTRPRGADEEEDDKLATELLADEKERAEHLMLVDLGRNDLGRVAEYGSVQVEQLMAVERYSHVQHLVTQLRARLRDGLGPFDALAAAFPAGTVTGAPKIRAMQILGELEPTPRGVYAGAVLYVDYAGNLDSCIAIRTIHVRGKVAQVQAGAGIVADSVPEREYQETLHKARAMLNALAMAERGF